MQHCLACGIKCGNLVCITCSKNPFCVEEARNELATRKAYDQLEKMYSSKYAEIKDQNTSDFWDEKLEELQTLEDANGLTKDRVKKAYSFTPDNANKILDIGAGQGYIEELLSNRNVQLYMMDISYEGLKLLKKRFYGDFQVGSIYNLKYKSSFFDVIYALEVLEHVPPSRILKVLKNINKLLKKGGFLIVSVPINEHLDKMTENPNGHVRDYSKELIFAELEMSGFEIEDFRQFSAFKNMYSFKKVLQRFIFKQKWEYNDIVVKARKV